MPAEGELNLQPADCFLVAEHVQVYIVEIVSVN